jgi:arginyl-tRNA synthetase
MVELPEGKMKSREGTVVDADELMDEMIATATEMAGEPGRLQGVAEDERADVLRMISLGALKYFILKVDPKKTMLFNPKESIDFNGNTGPFIQYTHARIRSILRKAAEQGLKAEASDSAVLSPKEVRLVKIVSAYPEKVREAADSFSPAVLANYSYELAKEFNQYYHDTQILREPDQVLLSMRLLLIEVVADVLRAAMSLLGIQLPDRM